MTKKQTLNIALYVGGFFITAFGILLILRSELGAGAWDTVNYNFSVLTGITIGTASISINLTLLLLLVLYRKQPKYLISIIPIFLIGVFIDFWDLIIFRDYYPTFLTLRGLFFIGGTFILTFGLALAISTQYPAMIFDELTLAIMKIIKTKSFFKARLIVEFFAIFTAIILGFIAGIGLGAVSGGSILLSIIIGPLLVWHMKWINRLRLKASA